MPKAQKVELAVSGRAKCKVCKDKIENKALRIGFETASQWGMQMNWHHASCFNFAETGDTDGLEGFASLPAADRDTITGKLGKGSATKAAPPAAKKSKNAAGAAAAPPAKKLKKHATALDEANPNEQGVCRIEYAQPKKPSPCADCSGGITNGEPRVGYSFPCAALPPVCVYTAW
jgi:hypothetical protein